MKQIKLNRYRNIGLQRREEDEILTIGKDLSEAQAATLVRIGNASWVEKKAKKKPAKKNKALDPVVEDKSETPDEVKD